MDEENKLFYGNCVISIFDKDKLVELPALENTIELDRATVRDKALSAPMRLEPITISGELKEYEKEGLELLENEWMGATMDKTDALREFTLIIEGKPRINRPKNLKYPNKKRAKRIWRKWRNRFGVTPTQRMVIPKAILSVTPAFRNNQQYYDIEAVVEKGDLK